MHLTAPPTVPRNGPLLFEASTDPDVTSVELAAAFTHTVRAGGVEIPAACIASIRAVYAWAAATGSSTAIATMALAVVGYLGFQRRKRRRKQYGAIEYAASFVALVNVVREHREPAFPSAAIATPLYFLIRGDNHSAGLQDQKQPLQAELESLEAEHAANIAAAEQLKRTSEVARRELPSLLRACPSRARW